MPVSSASEKDLRKIVHLLGSIIGAPNKPREKRVLLMEGLCKMINASCWIWSSVCLNAEESPPFENLIHGGFDERRLTLCLKTDKHRAVNAAIRRISLDLEANGHHLTRTREQIDPERILNHQTNAKLLSGLNIGPFIVSLRPIRSRWGNFIVIFRELESPCFTEREAKIAHILLSEVPWLHFQPLAQREEQITKLQPRHRVILNCLCEGWGRKKIADHLDLSVNTVHSYSKVVFKHFDVHSQSELIARLTRGDGGHMQTL